MNGSDSVSPFLKARDHYQQVRRLKIIAPDRIVELYMILKLPMVSIRVGENTYIAETAVILGEVSLADGVSIFDNAVIRGDMNRIVIGTNTNIQDNVTIHVDADNPTLIGEGVSLGHNCVVHGAEIGDFVIVGMGAIILNGAKIGSGSVIAAGSVVTEGFSCGEDSLVMGLPAKVKKAGGAMREYAVRNYTAYTKLRDRYLKGDVDRISGPGSGSGKR